MANYKEIQGFPIQNLTTDPTPYAQALVDNPYAGAWSSGGDLNQGAYAVQAVGTLTAGLKTGGYIAPTTATSNDTEEYNGTSWSEQTNMPTGLRYGNGFGVQTSAVFSAGSSAPGGGTDYFDDALEYNGSSWTVGGTMNTKRRMPGGAGASETDGLLFGGSSGSPDASNQQTVNELYNGTAWTEVGDLNTARYNGLTSAGTVSTAAIAAGGTSSGSGVTNVEVYNGSSWTEVSDLNSNKENSTIGGMGTSTDAVVVSLSTTESWDGSSWTEVAEVANSRDSAAAAGNQSNSLSGFLCAGNPAPLFAKTEEWTFSGLPPSTPAAGYSDAIIGQMYYNSTTGQFKAIKDGGAPIGTWASGGSTNTEAGQRGGASRSSTTNAFVSGGFRMGVPDVTTNAESYDGTSWTEGPNQPATNRIGAAWGTTISYVTAGGSTGISGAPINPYAFEWNGTSFSNGGTMNNARRNAAGAGVSETAGRAMAGGDNPGPAQAFNESYDGTSFTEETDVNTARIRPIGFGTTTSAIIASGSSGTNVEQWNGSSWTEIAEVLNATQNSAGGAGTTTDGLIFTNASPGTFATTQFWNGSSWTEVAELTVGRYANTGGGAGSTNAISVGGYGPPTAVTTSTEEWSAGDFDITTLTTS